MPHKGSPNGDTLLVQRQRVVSPPHAAGLTVWLEEQMVAIGWPHPRPVPDLRLSLVDLNPGMVPEFAFHWPFHHKDSVRVRQDTDVIEENFLALLEGPGADPWRTGQASAGRPALHLHPAGFRGLCPPRLPISVLKGVRKTGGEMG